MGKKYPWDGPGGQLVFGRLVLQFGFERDLKVTLEFGSLGDRFIVVFERSEWCWSLFGGQVRSVLLFDWLGPCSLMTQPVAVIHEKPSV